MIGFRFFKSSFLALVLCLETDSKSWFLSFCKEDVIATYSSLKEFPIIPCNLCGSQENLQRKKIKSLINDWEKDYPNRKSIIFNALKNISPSHMLDSKLYNFFQLQAELEKIDI